jgi:hypothetical protein
MKKYYCESRSRGISYVKYVNGRVTGFGHILRRNCLLRQVIEGMIKGGIEARGRRGRRRRKLLDDLRKERILTSEGGRSRSHYVESSL